ncbi:MAG: hypothetical protein KAI17_20020, partial [Thiotrichaceae bacterium]|nr:hypothetical protein [Thiotrichaceae bacterium]
VTSKRPEKNKTIDGKIIKHLALISSSLNSLNKDWANKLRGKIISKVETIFMDPGPILRKEKHKRFLTQFSDNNELVREKYFNDYPIEQKLFPNKYIENNSGKSIYPNCTISWLEFFIKYVSSAAKDGVALNESDDKNNAPSNELAKSITTATCTICGSLYLLDTGNNSREGKLCPKCGASGRAQAIAYYVSKILYDDVVPLNKHAVNKSKKIIGLSDGRVYADILQKKYDYTNTFYHREPFIDITCPPEKLHGVFDLLITTEVFEHINGPSIKAFYGALNILKPGGYMILTVPFINNGDSIEHYREGLKNYDSHQTKEGHWVAELEFNDGSKEVDEEARFHGGPGKTLEIRLFNRSRLISELDLAGFDEVVIHDENLPQWAIHWGPASRVITARKPLN